MAEIAENMQEGLLMLVVAAGLQVMQVMQAMMDADVIALAGPKGKHDQARTALRHCRNRGCPYGFRQAAEGVGFR